MQTTGRRRLWPTGRSRTARRRRTVRGRGAAADRRRVRRDAPHRFDRPPGARHRPRGRASRTRRSTGTSRRRTRCCSRCSPTGGASSSRTSQRRLAATADPGRAAAALRRRRAWRRRATRTRPRRPARSRSTATGSPRSSRTKSRRAGRAARPRCGPRCTRSAATNATSSSSTTSSMATHARRARAYAACPTDDEVQHLAQFCLAGIGACPMEREVLITGIGGQGVQLAAQVLARGAMLDGREVMFLGIYGGMMRGGNTDSTVVVADGPIEAPPVVSHAWAAIAMHDEYWEPVEAKLRPGGLVLVNDSTFTATSRPDVTVHRVDATGVATEVGNALGGVDGDDRRVRRADRTSSTATRSSRRCGSRSRRTAPNTSTTNERALRAGWELLPAERVSRPGRSRVSEPDPTRERDDHEPRHRHRSTSSTARAASSASRRARRRCSRCRSRSTAWATAIPELHPGCTGCAACLLVCPDFVFEVFRFDTPHVDTRSRHDRDARPHDARAHGRQRGAGARRDRVRLPLLRGLPDDAVHRAARALRPPAPRRGRRVHQRRVRARSGRHGVGRARDRRPRRDRARPARGSR